MADQQPSKPSLSKSALSALNRVDKEHNDRRKIIFQLGNDDAALSKRNNALASVSSDAIDQIFHRSIGRDSSNIQGSEINNIVALSRIAKEGDLKKRTSVRDAFTKFRKGMQDANDAHLKQLLQDRAAIKTVLYANYDLIIKIIPKMELVIKTYVNSIISPDDFTKRSLHVPYSGGDLSDEQEKEYANRISSILERHKISEDLFENISDYLVRGELIFLVSSINDELQQMLTESHSTNKPLDRPFTKSLFNTTTLTEAAAATSTEVSQDYLLLREGVEILKEDAGEAAKELDIQKLSEALNDVMTTSLVIGTAESIMLEANQQKDQIDAFNQIARTSLLTTKKDANASDNVAAAEAFTKINFRSNQAIVRKLKPENLVKLDFEGKTFGYIYLETFENDEYNPLQVSQAPNNGQPAGNSGGLSGSTGGNGSLMSGKPNDGMNAMLNNVVYSGSDVPDASSGQLGSSGGKVTINPKLMFIAGAFANRLSKETNIKLLRRNSLVKNAIYHSLSVNRILQKKDKLRIVFLNPDDVIHIDRKKSIFDNILFFAKIYIATLIALLMQNIVRGAAKRAYYVEVGMENDSSNVVESVVRDVKTSEVSGIHNHDIASIMNIVGDFNDYYIPVIDGEKPVTIDTIEALDNKSLDDEFLTWLSNNIFSGMGVPSSFTNDVENTDFAKTLSMQNSRFIRDIVSEQSILGTGYTNLLRRIWQIENTVAQAETKGDASDFAKSDAAQDREAEKAREKKAELTNELNIDISGIQAIFPSPLSLNMTNLSEQIDNVSRVTDTLVEAVPEITEEQKPVFTTLFKKHMFRRFISGLDWEDHDELISKALKDLTAKMLRDSKVTPPSGGDGADIGGAGESDI